MKGLVLEGGGAKGSYQIGAYKALKELNIKFDGVAGTSVGAINAALILQEDWDKAYELWYNINLSKIFNIDEKVLKEIRNLNFNHNNIKYIYNKLKNLLDNHGIELKKIRELLVENIDEDAIRKSGKDFGIVTINLSEMEPMELYLENIPDGSLVDYLIASSYLPAFKMEKMQGSLYLDGGFYNNLPINLLAAKGYKEIIAVRTFAMGRVRDFEDENLNITYISSEEDLGGVFDFKQENIRSNIDLGYYDTYRVFKKLKGEFFYIDVNHDENSDNIYMDFFLSLRKSQLESIKEILNIRELSDERLLFEKIVPKLAVLLDVEDECDYEEIVIALLEYAAKAFEIDRFKIYRFEEFVEEISNNYYKHQELESKNIPGFVRQSDLLSQIVSDQILHDIIDVIFNDYKVK
ncbi:MAG: patatin-like phospholipase family protein [Halanaerobiales bacterium]